MVDALESDCQRLLGAGDAEPEAGSPPQGPTEEGSTLGFVGSEGANFFFVIVIVVVSWAAPRGLRDLSSLTRDRTRAPCSGSTGS